MLDGSHSFQICLHSLPALDGWSVWRIQEPSSSLLWQPCLSVRPSARAPKVLYVRALPQPMSLHPFLPNHSLLILLTVPYSVVGGSSGSALLFGWGIIRESGSHRERETTLWERSQRRPGCIPKVCIVLLQDTGAHNMHGIWTTYLTLLHLCFFNHKMRKLNSMASKRIPVSLWFLNNTGNDRKMEWYNLKKFKWMSTE